MDYIEKSLWLVLRKGIGIEKGSDVEIRMCRFRWRCGWRIVIMSRSLRRGVVWCAIASED